MSFHRFLYRHAKRVVVAVIGGTVVLVGVVLLVTPGPAFVVIPLGLAILATEFVWARRLLRRVRDGGMNAYEKVRDGVRKGRNSEPADDPDGEPMGDRADTT